MDSRGSDRGRRLEHQQRAYELQLIGGFQGALRWTVYGLVGVGLAHHFLPTFRRQTWALKAFLVSSTSIFGLVIGADDYLLKYESVQREAENAIRREARNALAKRGVIATESEIRKWRAERDKERAEAVKAARDSVDLVEVAEAPEASTVAKLARDRAQAAKDAVDLVEIAEAPEANTVAKLARGPPGEEGGK